MGKNIAILGLLTLLVLGSFLFVQAPAQETSHIVTFAADASNSTADNTGNSTNTTSTNTGTGGAGFFDGAQSFIQSHLSTTVVAALIMAIGVLMIVHNRFSTILGIILFFGGLLYLLYTLGYLNNVMSMLHL